MKKKEVKVTKISINIRWLALLILVAFLFNFYFRFGHSKYKSITNESFSDCPIYYSEVECLKDMPMITFKNPTEKNYTNIQILVPKSTGVDVYNVLEPLEAYESRSLFLNASPCSINEKDIKFRWCCASNCYEINLKNPRTITTFETTSIESCERLPTVRKLFCYADIAEITNNISICYLINDTDISSLCFAQLTLNESRCGDIRDNELKEACIESVKTKIYWKNK